MKATVFFSWQSDVRAAACRTLIQQALEGAAKAIASDDSIAIEPVVDRDTQDVPGAPDIGAAILSKIDNAAVFVGDVTIVGETRSGKPTPNPNVLVELGYALKALGWSRVVLVQNTAFGRPEMLPFDLRQKRTLTYSSAEEAKERSTERRKLRGTLETALRSILTAPRSSPKVDLKLDYETKTITSARHDYELVTTVTNSGTKRLDDWEIEIEFPTPLLDGTIHTIKVDDRSDARTTFFRVQGPPVREPLRPGDTTMVRIGYFVDQYVYRQRAEFFENVVKARVLVNGEVTDKEERKIRELQNF